MLSVDEAIRM